MKDEVLVEQKPRTGQQDSPKRTGCRPAKVFRQGACSASVFFNSTVRDGRSFDLPSVSFAKLYRKEGRLRATSSLGREDLACAIVVLGQAYEWLKQLAEESEEVMPYED